MSRVLQRGLFGVWLLLLGVILPEIHPGCCRYERFTHVYGYTTSRHVAGKYSATHSSAHLLGDIGLLAGAVPYQAALDTHAQIFVWIYALVSSG